MRHIAVIGSGPAGYYTAEASQKLFGDDVRIDIIDRLPTPYGLIRFGVAPDHQSIKAVTKRYEATILSDSARFVGNVSVGKDVSVEELRSLYDAVVFATGAPSDRPLDIPGADLPGVVGSAAFVGWYNGHPEFTTLAPPLEAESAVIIGNGNVAIDVARILAKSTEEFEGSDIVDHAFEALKHSKIRTITIVGRRGPHQIGMTPKELAEIGKLKRATPIADADDFPPVEEDTKLDPTHRKSLGHLRSFIGQGESASKPIKLIFDFFAQPIRIEGRDCVERVIIEHTHLNDQGRSEGESGSAYAIPCGLVIPCIGYRTPPIPGIPYDQGAGRFANEKGRISPGLYAVGWARRGPTGTIGANRPDGFMIAEAIAADQPKAADKPGGAALDRLLAERGVQVVSFTDWRKIEAAEAARAHGGKPREKFTAVDDMMGALKV